MKICHFDFSQPFELKNGSGVLICENPARFLQYCNDFLSQQKGIDGDFIIQDGDESVPFKKCGSIIFDFFNLSLNDKKIVSGLYRRLSEIVNENMQQEYLQLAGQIVSLLDSIAIDSPTAVEYDLDFEVADILKATKMKPSEEDRPLIEKIADYLDATANFCGTKLFVLVNARGYFDDKEFENLLTHISYSAYEVLFLERTQYDRVKEEPMRIIDNDFCEIIVEDENVC